MPSEQCPCKSVIQLAERTTGEFKLINRELKESKEHFEELKFSIKECVDQLNEGSKLLTAGSFKFKSLKRQVKYLWVGFAVCATTLVVSGHAGEFIKIVLKLM